jgi:adenylate cyclase
VKRLRALASTARNGMYEVAHPGEQRLRGETLERLGRVALTLVIVVTNLIGACAVLVIALFVVPTPAIGRTGHVRLVNAIAAACYVGFAVLAGVLAGNRGMRPLRRWLLEDRTATLEETRIVLQAPLRLFALQLGLWLVAAVVFGVINATYDALLAMRVATIVVLTGLVTASCAYLLTEMLLRPAAARALVDGAPGRLSAPGVATRAILAWAFGTGLPVLGVVGVGVLALTGDHSGSRHQLGIAMVVLGGTGIVVGLLAVGLAARATADPVDSVRRALAKVQRGDFDLRVPVYDGSQIGQLQLGFNAMVVGLAEREKIRRAFGTYVDPDVAERVLEEGTALEGEEVEVTVMFVDVRDFTGFAERTAAPEVVAALNHLFEQIVPVVHDHGGWVDKFVGDGLLAVFGAPRRQSDHADQALAAALEIAEACRSGESELQVGIGLNSGTVVAGNVGGAGRLEFSVIGDAVNIAARVEAATRETDDIILLTGDTKALLREQDGEFTERNGIELKGKREPVRVYAPERAAGATGV